MQLFICDSETVEAVQFFPMEIWPEPVKKWTNYVPRDMSWGYVETERGRVHVLAGDWILKKENGQWDVCIPELFEKTYKPATLGEKKYPSNRRSGSFAASKGQGRRIL